MTADITENLDQPETGSSLVVLDGPGTSLVPAANSRQVIDATNSLTSVERAPIGGANNEFLSDLADRVREYEDGLTGNPTPMSRLRVQNNRIMMDHGELTLDNAGVARLCSTIGAPASYLERLPAELLSLNLEYGLREVGSREDGLSDENSEILSRNGKFVGFRRWDLCSLLGTDVLDALREGLGNIGGVSGNLTFGHESFTLDVVGEAAKKEVRKGDVLKAGIHLEHSLLGEEATSVSAYVIRLRCLNGMTQRECVGARRTRRTRRLSNKNDNARTLQYEQVKSLVADIRAKLEQKLEAIQKLQDRKIRMSDIERTFEQFLRRGRLYSNNIMRLLQRAWHNEMGGDNELTYFGILNALTWLATHPAELTDERGKVIYHVTDRQRAALANLSGIFANQEVHICPSCFSLVAGRAEAVTSHEGAKA